MKFSRAGFKTRWRQKRRRCPMHMLGPQRYKPNGKRMWRCDGVASSEAAPTYAEYARRVTDETIRDIPSYISTQAGRLQIAPLSPGAGVTKIFPLAIFKSRLYITSIVIKLSRWNWAHGSGVYLRNLVPDFMMITCLKMKLYLILC